VSRRSGSRAAPSCWSGLPGSSTVSPRGCGHSSERGIRAARRLERTGEVGREAIASRARRELSASRRRSRCRSWASRR